MNKRKLLFAILGLILSAAMLFSCTQEQNGGEDSESVSETEAVDTDAPKVEELMILSRTAVSDYVIVRPASPSIETFDIICDFADKLGKKTGADMLSALRSESTEPQSKEIIVGLAEAREESAALLDEVGLTGCAIRIVEEKIIVAAHNDALLEQGLDALLNAIEESTVEAGAFGISKDFSASLDKSYASVHIPMYKSANATLEGIYYCGEKNYQLSYKGTTLSEYETFLDTLEQNGFSLYDTNAIGDCRFATYTAKNSEGEGTAVYTMHYPSSQQTKIIWGPEGYLPSTAQIAKGGGVQKIAQLGRDGMYQLNNGAPGLCYIITLSDGRFILFDGGPKDTTVEPMKLVGGVWTAQPQKTSDDAERIYNYLCENNTGGGKPVIAAWFITHAHSDHITLATAFLKDHKDDIVLEVMGFNFPDFNTIDITNENDTVFASYVRSLKAVLSNYYRDTETFVFHTGQEMYFPDCEIEIIYTQEDYYPNPFPYANHTSAAFRITLGDTTFVLLGDCEAPLCASMASMYGTAIKSDILQVTHHGANGGDLQLYKNINPKICFWDCSDYAFYTNPQQLGTASGFSFNKWVRENVPTHYYGTVTTEIIC